MLFRSQMMEGNQSWEMGQVDLGQLVVFQVELSELDEPRKAVPGQAPEPVVAEAQVLQAAAVPKRPYRGGAQGVGAQVQDLELPQPVEQLWLQRCHLVERQIQDLEVDEVDEGYLCCFYFLAIMNNAAMNIQDRKSVV